MAYSALQLAEAFIKAGELDDALAALNDHLAGDRSDENGYRLRAEVLIRLNTPAHLEQARDDLRLIATPTASDCFMQAVVLENLADMEGAAAILEQGCKHYPENQRLWERWLHNLLKSQKMDQAKNLIHTMLEAQPDDWRWSQWAGDIAFQTGDYKEAAEQYHHAIKRLETHYHLNTHSPAHVISSTSGDASALSVSGSYARLHITLAEALAANNHLYEAKRRYEQAAILLPDDPVIPFKLGMLAAQQNDLAQAALLCQTALNKMPPALRQTMLDSLQANSLYTTLFNQLQ